MIQVVLLAAGEGKRMGELSKKIPKPLLPVGDSTLMARHISFFGGAGFRDFIIVVSPGHSAVRSEAEKSGILPRFEVQFERRGIGDALLRAAKHISSEFFILVLADVYCEMENPAKALSALSENADAVLSLRRTDNAAEIRKECTVKVSRGLKIERIVEKPEIPLSEYKPCGIYFFRKSFLDAVRETPPSALRGEIEITDAIENYIRGGAHVMGIENVKYDVNVTYPSDLLKANLSWLRFRNRPFFSDRDAVLEKGALIENSVIRGRCVLGEGAVVRDSLVFGESRIPPGSSISGSVVFQGFKLKTGRKAL